MSGDSEPADLVSIKSLAELLGVSASHVRQLADRGLLPATRTSGGHRRFEPVAAREAWDRYLHTRHKQARAAFREQRALASADEAAMWDAIRPRLALPERADAVAHYVTTEMVNNAIDHSGGASVTLTATWQGGMWTVEVVDDGDGLFDHLAVGLGLVAPVEALAELTKGKRTTDPRRHTGEGIFFSSKAVETFTVEANGYRLTFDNPRQDVAYGTSTVTTGTVVRYTIDPETDRTLRSLFDRFTDADFRFSKTVPRIKLYEIGVRFVSRSEAKRLGVGLENFTDVELDFTGVVDVGQGFVDELFRVWATDHPDTTLSPIGMNDAVDFMVRRTRGR